MVDLIRADKDDPSVIRDSKNNYVAAVELRSPLQFRDELVNSTNAIRILADQVGIESLEFAKRVVESYTGGKGGAGTTITATKRAIPKCIVLTSDGMEKAVYFFFRVGTNKVLVFQVYNGKVTDKFEIKENAYGGRNCTCGKICDHGKFMGRISSVAWDGSRIFPRDDKKPIEVGEVGLYNPRMAMYVVLNPNLPNTSANDIFL